MGENKNANEPFERMMNEMNKKFDTLFQSISKSEQNLNTKISESEAKVIEHIDSKYNELSEQIIKLEERVSKLESDDAIRTAKITNLEMESAAKSSYITSLEMKINRCNFILFNFEENEVTPEELITNLIQFFSDVMKVIIKHSDFDVIYRLGKAQPRKIRPVFISLTTVKMRDYIFSCRRNLKGSKVSISDDCPKEIIEKRKKLLPALLGAKKLKKKAYFKYGTLVVNGVACSEEDIENYCKTYTESSKRPRSTDTTSPSNFLQEHKKPKSLSNIVRNAGKQRSISLSNSPVPHSSQQITKFFDPTISNSPNSKVFLVQSNQ